MSAFYLNLGRVLLILALLAAASVAGWIVFSTENSELVFTTGSEVGLYYRLAGHLQEVAEADVTGATITLESSSGSQKNIARLEEGLAQLAIVQNDSIGNGSIRSLAALYTEVLHLICRTETQINSLEDLKEHRVSIGAKGSGTEQVVKSLLNFARVDLGTDNTIQDDFETTSDMLSSGDLDAAFFLVGIGSPVITNLMRDDRMQLAPVQMNLGRDGAFDMATAQFVEGFQVHYPYVTYHPIPMMAYEGRPSRPVPALGIQAVLVCRDDLDSSIAEKLTRVLFEKRAVLGQKDRAFSKLDEANAQTDLQFPIHPGAESFYRRREPGFLTKYAESMGFIVTVLLLGWSGFSGAHRWYRHSRKNRVDKYYNAVLGILERIEECNSVEDIDGLERELRDIERFATTELVNEKIEADEAFLILQNMYIRCDVALSAARTAKQPQDR